ncbi:glutaredoxin domain-containing cysteine-rich protein CG31559-like [Daktulosphaira vitifoliae]|uniref:glutaredoxin domain-containing cysteine-rich protein CG31559-like n=1 Tax=Daktulosphaira vitifoliae TaxID=58002 RepID=UPI0021AA049E|nr:glutaredoxin domain-containing cysteine-rich protein CG31559-like [Daktulosphaira vitifoliae]
MIEAVEKKIPPPLPPKSRRACHKSGDINGATILSSGHVVKIRIDPTEVIGCVRESENQQHIREDQQQLRRTSTVKINITCVDPYVFYDDRCSSSGHASPLDSGTGSDLDSGSRRDESDDGTCSSCDSLTSAGGVEPDVKEESSIEQEHASPSPPSAPLIMVEQRSYDQRTEAKTPVRIIDLDNTDQYYEFHMNENVFEHVDKSAASKSPEDDSFAGCKVYEAAVGSADTIRSAKGTIRGVKNRVRAGIATFLQPKTSKTWQEKEAGKIVLYTTTMGIVRDTYQRCLLVKQILRTHLVKFVERDVFMSREVQKEIKERLGTNSISVPQLFVEGNLIGDAEAVERLNESGELRSILKPFKSPDAWTTCQICGGYRLLPCPMCNGSKKSVHRNHFTTEMIALKCMNCDEVGLVQCYAC